MYSPIMPIEIKITPENMIIAISNAVNPSGTASYAIRLYNTVNK